MRFNLNYNYYFLKNTFLRKIENLYFMIKNVNRIGTLHCHSGKSGNPFLKRMSLLA